MHDMRQCWQISRLRPGAALVVSDADNLAHMPLKLEAQPCGKQLEENAPCSRRSGAAVVTERPIADRERDPALHLQSERGASKSRSVFVS
jgi:hypothetical protein